MALRRSASPRTSSNPIPSPSAKSGFARSMIRACEQTIGLKTHTSRFGGENENSSGSNRLDQLNASCRSTPPSRTPSTSNAIFCLAPSSRRFGPRRLLSGGRAASQPDPWCGALRPTAAVNVSMPSGEEAVTSAYAAAFAPFLQSDGTVRVGASFRCLIAQP